MSRLINSSPRILINHFYQTHQLPFNSRTINRLYRQKSSSTIRKDFLDYFQCLDHKHLPSSRVAPIFDSSVSFTNAGMNQFKKVLLGAIPAPHPRVANHQKCVRVGGKHNDLADVGYDDYHHTFFEMLGSWSFNDYGRREACAYALTLLTGPFGISKDQIVVTYFAGEESPGGLKKDFETLETWRSLGILEERILARGVEDNFWEMGLTGPCGPCTEIHVLTQPEGKLRELWNIVFIEHNRLPGGEITPLQHQHVDTGLGFERLVAFLQGKTSNYDTDLFSPIFNGIQLASKAPAYSGQFNDANSLDTAYRILADHARMATVCLADGMVPEENHKLRRIIRRAITVSHDVFKKQQLLGETCNFVAESLGNVYPEIVDNLNHIKSIINYEEELLKKLRMTSGKQWQKIVAERPILAKISDPCASGLVQGYKEFQRSIKNLETRKIPGELSFRLYDTFGLEADVIEELAEIENLVFDREAFEEYLKKAKLRSRIGLNQSKTETFSDGAMKQLDETVKTDDSSKYSYESDEGVYKFPEVDAEVLRIFVNRDTIENSILEINKSLENKEIGLVLNRTPFYTTEGGQLFDKGTIIISSENIRLNVENVRKIGNHVVHLGKLDFSNFNEKLMNAKLIPGDRVKLVLDTDRRLAIMRHHTATHLLNAALRTVFPAVAQKASVVKEDHLSFQFTCYGKGISQRDIDSIDELINDCIAARLPVMTRITDQFGFTQEKNLVLIPGTLYPDQNLRIVEVEGTKLRSKELCCGTHVINTGDLVAFRVTSVMEKGASSRIINAVAGPAAKNLNKFAFDGSSKDITEAKDKKNLEAWRDMLQDFVMSEAKHAVEKGANNEFIVFLLLSKAIEVESLPLQFIRDVCTDKPIFVVVQGKRKVRTRCFVPKQFITKDFNADLWMREVNKVIKSTIGAFDDQDPLLTSHLKVTKFPRTEVDKIAKESVEAARIFAQDHCRSC